MQDPRNVGENLKRVPPKSLPTVAFERLPSRDKRSARTSPSTFLFLPIHLSNSPGTTEIPLPETPESRRSPRQQTEAGRLVTLSVRSFAGAPSRRKVGGAPSWGLYRGGPGPLSTDNLAQFQRTCPLWIEPRAGGPSVVSYSVCAALAPHSCSVVCAGEKASDHSPIQSYRRVAR